MVNYKKIATFALVNELERHIEILLLSNDCVIVPDFGGFMAHHVDARYDGRDDMFLPPLRTIGFNPQLKMNDSLLALSYVEAYDISYPDAISRIAEDVREVRAELEANGKYELTDIGTLYLNDNGNYNFEPCEAGLLTPDYYGLGGFEMRPLKGLSMLDGTDEDLVSANVDTTCTPNSEAAAEPVVPHTENAEIKSINDLYTNDEENAEFIHIKKSWLRNAVAACIAIIAFFALSTPLETPNIQKSQIDTSMLNRIFPKEVVKGEPINALTLSSEGKAESNALTAPSKKQDNAESIDDESAKPYYSIVLASRVAKRNAANYVESLQAKGFKDAKVLITTNNVKVIYGAYDTERQAYAALNRLHHNEAFVDGWITKVKE